MVRRVRPRCAMYDVVWRQWGQGRGEGWVSKRDEGRKSLDVPRRGDAGIRGGVWGRGEEGRVHTLSGGLRQRGDEGWLGWGGGELKAGLLVGFNYICLYLHNKQQPRRSVCLGMPVPLLVFSPRSTRSAR